MTDKKPRPHHVIRTTTPAYFFGSAKAAATNPYTKKRQPAKLPTSLDELKAIDGKKGRSS